MFSFEKLNVYQTSLDLIDDIYKITDSWPKSEMFGLTGQIRRAAVSISLNIAEGSGRTKKDFKHFLDISRSSCSECIPLFEIAKRRGLVSDEDFELFYNKLTELSKRISSLKRSIKI